MNRSSVTRFYFGATMISYFANILGILLAAAVIGWRSGRRRQNQKGKLSPVTTGILVGLGLGWFVAAKLARNYADTDGFGSVPAEWFAHAGKWLVLLGAMMFGHGWIYGAGQLPVGSGRRVVYYVAVLGMAALVVSRTLPVYFLLGAGGRDADGYLRQSEKFEFTCGAVALLNYLERYQHQRGLTEREVARACGVTPEGSTTAAILRAAHHFGLTNATAQVLNWQQLDQQKLPVIVSISTLPQIHHATLLVSLDEQAASFLDPAYGPWKISRARFQQIWYGKTVRLE